MTEVKENDSKSLGVVAENLISPYMTSIVGQLRVLNVRMSCNRHPDGNFHYIYTLRGEMKESNRDEDISKLTRVTSQSAKLSKSSKKSKVVRKKKKLKDSQKTKDSSKSTKSFKDKNRLDTSTLTNDFCQNMDSSANFSAVEFQSTMRTYLEKDVKEVKFVLLLTKKKTKVEKTAKFSENATLKNVLKYFHAEFKSYLKEGYMPRMALIIDDKSIPLKAKMGNSTLKNILWEKKNLIVIADTSVFPQK